MNIPNLGDYLRSNCRCSVSDMRKFVLCDDINAWHKMMPAGTIFKVTDKDANTLTLTVANDTNFTRVITAPFNYYTEWLVPLSPLELLAVEA